MIPIDVFIAYCKGFFYWFQPLILSKAPPSSLYSLFPSLNYPFYLSLTLSDILKDQEGESSYIPVPSTNQPERASSEQKPDSRPDTTKPINQTRGTIY